MREVARLKDPKSGKPRTLESALKPLYEKD